MPGSLQGNILAAAEEVERTNRRVAVVDPEEEGLHRLPAGGKRDRLAVVPAGGEGGQKGVEGADDDEVDRIAPLRAGGIGRRRRQGLEPADELGWRTGDDTRRRHERVEVEVEVIGSDPWHGDSEVKIDDRGARRQRGGLRPRGGHGGEIDGERFADPGQGRETDIDHLRTGIERREHEALGAGARFDGGEAESAVSEEVVHPGVVEPGGEELQGDEDQDHRDEQPADDPEGGEPAEDREVAKRRRLQGREVGGIEAHDLKAKAVGGAVLDADKDRLDAAAVDRDAEEALRFPPGEDGNGDLGAVVRLGLGPLEKAVEPGLGAVRGDHEPAELVENKRERRGEWHGGLNPRRAGRGRAP